MNFLALIIAVVLERFSGAAAYLQEDGWYQRWQSTMGGKVTSGLLGAALTVAIPAIVAQFILLAATPILFGLLWIALAVILLLYSFGRVDLAGLQERYRGHCRRDDLQGAWLEVGNRLGWDEDAPDEEQTPEQVHARIQRAFLYASLGRWFGVLFWFLVLGPAGALAYRLCQLLPAGEDRDTLLFYVDWLPARALAATFSLVGNLTESSDEFWLALSNSDMPMTEILYSVAMAATGEDKKAGEEFTGARAAAQNEVLANLQWRAGVCWIVVISVLVIID
ncbi:hypothetical protein E4634_07835 [Mangrovimicrobium sediminis]|uniref:Regulatory signaling modulator protein AmpE n=1 Tax=Mangrovimicrobium sediminis TaxID=2562682 RepID=A0A4Z0M3L7_9GAMM|nr:regulatory signaling modulator protein AmpE [Haliea sp. SAOS-164]TGD74040.1 hypothetical protein E4634_07835 [Haliea sp. SAOS-164]